MTTKGKVLVLVSSGRGLPLKDGKVYTGAGYYLNELTVPVRALMKEGYEITFANPKGNAPQVDVHSEVADFFGGDAAKLQDYMIFRDGLTGLRDPTRIADVIASGLDQYDAVFVPGGHGPMIDLLKSYVLQDRELISGQNPFSDEALLKLLLPALNKKKSEGARA